MLVPPTLLQEPAPVGYPPAMGQQIYPSPLPIAAPLHHADRSTVNTANTIESLHINNYYGTAHITCQPETGNAANTGMTPLTSIV